MRQIFCTFLTDFRFADVFRPYPSVLFSYGGAVVMLCQNENKKRVSDMNLKLFCWCFVVDRGIEPLCQDWESCILTIRWIHHLSLTIEDCCGSWGIRTPGTINSYGSLANCWFQPLTQTSLPIIFIVSFSLKRGAKVRRFFYISKYFRTFFSKKLIFLCFSLENGSFWPVLPLFLIFCSCSYALLGKVLFGSK